MDSCVSALVISMSYLSIVVISYLRVLWQNFEFSCSLFQSFSDTPWSRALTTSIVCQVPKGEPFLGHTNLGILQSLQILLVFGVFNRSSFHYYNVWYNPLHSGWSRLSDILYFLKWSHPSNLRVVKREKGYGLTKRGYMNKLRREEM